MKTTHTAFGSTKHSRVKGFQREALRNYPNCITSACGNRNMRQKRVKRAVRLFIQQRTTSVTLSLVNTDPTRIIMVMELPNNARKEQS